MLEIAAEKGNEEQCRVNPGGLVDSFLVAGCVGLVTVFCSHVPVRQLDAVVTMSDTVCFAMRSFSTDRSQPSGCCVKRKQHWM